MLGFHGRSVSVLSRIRRPPLNGTIARSNKLATMGKTQLPPIKKAPSLHGSDFSKAAKRLNTDDVQPIVIYLPYPYSHFRNELQFPELPTLENAPLCLVDQLLDEKIQLCCQLCDFTSSRIEKEQKKIKAHTLSEILSYVNKNTVTDEVIDKLFKMVAVNLNRQIPKIPDIISAVDEEPILVDPTWEHLSTIYLILHRITTITKSISSNFLQLIIKVLSSPLPQEREKIVIFINTCAVRFPQSRQIIMDCLMNQLSSARLSKQRWTPIGSCLQILANFYDMCPLSQSSYKSIILPLVTLPTFRLFEVNLIHLVTAYLANHNDEITFTANYVLEHFPFRNSFKQPKYIHFFFFILEMMTPQQFEDIASGTNQLFEWFAKNNCVKVADTLLQSLTSEKLQVLIIGCPTVYSVVRQSLIYISNEHWCGSVQNAAIGALHLIGSSSKPSASQSQNVPLSTHDKEHTGWTLIARNAANEYPDIDMAQSLSMINRCFPARTRTTRSLSIN